MGPCVSLCVVAGVNLDRGLGNVAESEIQPADFIVEQAVLGSGVQRLQVVERMGTIWVASGVIENRLTSAKGQ
jgi:hypothetical protein